MVPNGSAYADYPVFAGSGTKVKPSPDAKYAQGFLPGETLPAEWANYLFYGATGGVTRLNADTDSIKKELNSILTAYGITNNADAYNQVLTALNRIYPQICECSTAASTEVKSVAITGDGVILKAGNVYAITMTNGNTYGDGSSTYPKLSINSGTAYPLCDATGAYLKSGAWAAGDVITVLFTGTKFLKATGAVTDTIENGNENPVASNAVSCVISDSPNPTVLTGPALGVGGNFKVLFKAAISASDTTTPLSLTYNGTAYTVKARKDGALQNVYAHEVQTNVFKFLQAYTTIEFVYDGTDLIIMGNPVVLSSTDYTIYADGNTVYANENVLSDWEELVSTTSTVTPVTALYDGIITITVLTNQTRYITINGINFNRFSGADTNTSITVSVRKNDIISVSGSVGSYYVSGAFYKNRDYSNR